MKKCKSCGTLAENSVNFCSNCGTKEFYNICANCGHTFEGGMFCVKCGTKMVVPASTVKEKPKENAQTQQTNPTPKTDESKPQPAKKTGKGSTILGLLIVVLIAFAIGSFISDGFVSFFTDDDDKKSVTITMEEFDELETGMSYSEVIEVVGGKGELRNENGKGTDFHTQIYRYKGKDDSAYATLYFINGQLQTKSQFGLDEE